MAYYVELAVAAAVLVYLAYTFLGPRRDLLTQVHGPPKAHWLFGTLAGAFAETREKLWEWGAKYPGTYVVDDMFGTKAIITTDRTAINFAFSDTFNWGMTDQVKELMKGAFGYGVLIENGDEHKNQRRVLSPAFSVGHINALTPDIRMLACRLAKLWGGNVDSASTKSADGSVEINAYDWLSRMTFDGIGYTGFGHDFHTLTPETVLPEDALSKSFRTVFYYMHGEPLAILESFFPILRLLPTRRRKIVSSSEAFAYGRITELVEARKREMMEKSEGEVKKGDVKGKDLLSLLLKANMASDLKPSERLSDENIVKQVGLFIAAGHDTTTNTVSFCMLALVQNPDVQERLRQELLECEALAPGGEVTYQTLADLKYLDAVVNETLRLFPAGPYNSRTVYHDLVVPFSEPVMLKSGKTVTELPIKKGDKIIMPHTNFDAKIWGPDVVEFKPSRWLNLNNEQEAVPGWNHLSSFGYGPKNCIGQRFAALQIRVILATVVREFVFTPAPRTSKIVRKTKILQKPYVEGEDDAPQVPVMVRRYVPTKP